jgi:hypothetical protein
MKIMANCEENQHNLILWQASLNTEPTEFWGGGDQVTSILPMKFLK